MHPRWSLDDATPRLRVPLRLAALATLAAAIALAVAGCSQSANTGSRHFAHCGTSRTAANVPVTIEVARGQVSCQDAMTVEHRYSKAVANGKAPGNGGGGPVNVGGWKCQGFPTPEVLKTGWASKCVRDSTEILAILPSPS